jgi:hypothetical protein
MGVSQGEVALRYISSWGRFANRRNVPKKSSTDLKVGATLLATDPS